MGYQAIRSSDQTIWTCEDEYDGLSIKHDTTWDLLILYKTKNGARLSAVKLERDGAHKWINDVDKSGQVEFKTDLRLSGEAKFEDSYSFTQTPFTQIGRRNPSWFGVSN